MDRGLYLIPTIAVLAGLSALPLLPIGAFVGVHSVLFQSWSVVHYAALLFAAAAALRELIRAARHTRAHLRLIGVGVGLAALCALCLLPVTARDALIHHLAIPKLWLESGKIEAIPWHSWSFYPMLANLGFISLLDWGLETGTAFYHALYLILLCGVAQSFAVQVSGDEDLGVDAFFCALFLPILFRLASTPLVDLPLVLWSFTTLLFLIRWREDRAAWSLLLTGVSAGLALSTKYNGLLGTVVFAMAALWYLVRGRAPSRTILKPIFTALPVALLIYGPWMIKNWAATGNPLYPLMQSTLGGPLLHGAGSALSPLTSRLVAYDESLLDYLLLPLRMIFLGQDDLPKYFDGVLNPLVIFALLPMIRPRGRPWVGFLSVYTALYWILAALLAGPRIRYLAPIFGPLVILTVIGIREAAALCGGRAGAVRRVLLTGYAAFSLWYVGGLFVRERAVDYLRGTESREQYLHSSIAEYSLIEFANSELSSNSRVYLLLTGNLFYYYERDVRSAGHFSASELTRWIRDSKSAPELRERLRQQGITHLAAHVPRLMETLEVSLSGDEAKRWNDFVQSELVQIYFEAPYVVWSVP